MNPISSLVGLDGCGALKKLQKDSKAFETHNKNLIGKQLAQNAS